MARDTSATVPASRTRVAAVLVLGVAVGLAIGTYAEAHRPALRPLFLVGFSGMLQMKAWLATVVLALVLVQVVSALWMWRRLPGVHSSPRWLAPTHRWSGTAAFVVSLPVAVHCVWSLGFVTTTPRVLAHSVLGCTFYGAYAAKMLGLRLRGMPARLIPLLGGFAFAVLVIVWLTSALWFFTRSGLPLT